MTNLGLNIYAVQYFASEGAFGAVFSKFGYHSTRKTPYQFIRRDMNELTLQNTDVTTILAYILGNEAESCGDKAKNSAISEIANDSYLDSYTGRLRDKVLTIEVMRCFFTELRKYSCNIGNDLMQWTT